MRRGRRVAYKGDYLQARRDSVMSREQRGKDAEAFKKRWNDEEGAESSLQGRLEAS